MSYDVIVIGGGPCAYNPEPLADFFDFFYLGEGETVYNEILDKYKEHKAKGGGRRAIPFPFKGVFSPKRMPIRYAYIYV